MTIRRDVRLVGPALAIGFFALARTAVAAPGLVPVTLDRATAAESEPSPTLGHLAWMACRARYPVSAYLLCDEPRRTPSTAARGMRGVEDNSLPRADSAPSPPSAGEISVVGSMDKGRS